jgi:hypothetical protein
MEVILWTPLATLAVVTGVWLLYRRVTRIKRSFWKFLVFGVFAPTYADSLTSANQFFAGMRCFAWSLIFLSVMVIDVYAFDALFGRDDPPRVFLGVMFVSGLFSAMAFVKGWYYLIRSALRRKRPA